MISKLLIALTALSIITIGTYYLSSNQETSLNVIIVGDVGTGLPDQYIVANKMEDIAQEQNSDFVLSFGDNFYPHGVTGLEDLSWKYKFEEVYMTDRTPYLKGLDFYGSIGNHDFYGEDVFSEIQYQKINPHWVIENFFYTHTHQVGDKTVAFVHVDTNLLYYGYDCPDENMKRQFDELGWKSDDQMLEYAEQQLKKVQKADWIFTQAHHPIGYSCPQGGHTAKYYELFQKYSVDGYLNGHAHMLSYKVHSDMLFLTSGAGSKIRAPDQCQGDNPTFLVANIIGFMSLNIYEDYLTIQVYYTKTAGIGGWNMEQLPDFQRRVKNN